MEESEKELFFEESDDDSECDLLVYFDRLEQPQFFIDVLMKKFETLETILCQYIDKFGDISDS